MLMISVSNDRVVYSVARAMVFTSYLETWKLVAILVIRQPLAVQLKFKMLEKWFVVKLSPIVSAHRRILGMVSVVCV